MYRMAIRRFYQLYLMILFSCSTQVEPPELEVMLADTLKVNEKVLAKIFSKNNNWEIIKAYVDCEGIQDLNGIELDNEKIRGCTKELFVKNDTILIQFTPTELGPEEFGQIMVLMNKGNNEYQLVKSGFSYVVVQNKTMDDLNRIGVE